MALRRLAARVFARPLVGETGKARRASSISRLMSSSRTGDSRISGMFSGMREETALKASMAALDSGSCVLRLFTSLT